MSTLIVVGAGPKAIAIAAKRAALKAHGMTVPDLVVIDRHGIGANWLGDWGYTHGGGLLGTSPSKDLGFPYPDTALFHDTDEFLDSLFLPSAKDTRSISEWMLSRFSYQSYLISSTGVGDYVDAGEPPPRHDQWARYLRWAANRLLSGPEDWRLRFVQGEVGPEAIDLVEERWSVQVALDDDSATTIAGDGLVITGPGEPKPIEGQLDVPERWFDGKSFWLPDRQTYIRRVREKDLIVVIGTGETTASVLVRLQECLEHRPRITVISPTGMLHSRGEGYWENTVFTDPQAWRDLEVSQRKQFIARTDRGVLSPKALTSLHDLRGRIDIVEGHVERVARYKNRTFDLIVSHESGAEETLPADYVVNCRGFDAWSFRQLFRNSVFDHFEESNLLLQGTSPDGDPGSAALERVQSAIGEDLSIQRRLIDDDLPIEGGGPRLHLPLLSGLAQGPGFPNLSSLGRLADRILSSYAWGPLKPPPRKS